MCERNTMKISVLNLAPLRQGETFKDAMDAMVRLVQKVEKLGYERFWVAEHHNMKAIASSATPLLIQLALSETSTIRVGSGGIMLPNHSPYVVAEQFGTLETLYPNRVDLGLGRAPGTDMVTARALRRTDQLFPNFREDIAELQSYFEDSSEVHAYPAAGLHLPLYILGSSTESAYLAAELGLPYAFASHFAPAMMEEAVEIYRRYFKPSAHFDKPYVILGANVIMADTNQEAKHLWTTQLQSILGIVTGQPSGLKPPMDKEEEVWKDFVSTHKVPHFGPIAFEKEELIHREKQIVQQMSQFSFVGSPATVKEDLLALQKRLDFDEMIVTASIFDEQAQHYSYQLFAEVVADLSGK